MATIPLPALHTDQIAPPPNVLQQYGQLMQLKNQQAMQPLQQQQAANEVQSSALDVQQKQQDQNDQKAIQKWFMGIDPKDPNAFDPISVGKTLAQAGVSGKGIMGAQQQLLAHQQTVLTMTKDQLANQQEVSGNVYNGIGGVIGVTDPTERAQKLTPLIQMAAQNKILDPNQAQQMLQNPAAVTDEQLKNMQHGLGVSSAFMASVARKQQADTEQGKVNASMNPQSSLYAPSAASVALGTAPGAAQIQQGEAKQAAIKAGAEESARLPGEMALARQRQALSQGDPNAAAQLLINGDATLSELKSRGATPDFIANTLAAAHQLSQGQYNAQQADAAFQVAKSPAQVQFFGSAGSLVSKGGTLDQLADAAKDLPNGQFPSFNKIADWEKAATGNGPIAKYASLALGAADDYAKVMGGGQGSDTSRLQALNLFAAQQSPAQRVGSIQGVRGAVNSQANSRIGSNPILKRMYGDQFTPNQSGGTPTPQTHAFSLSAWQAANPKGDPNAAKAAAQAQGYTVTQ